MDNIIFIFLSIEPILYLFNFFLFSHAIKVYRACVKQRMVLKAKEKVKC